MPCELMSAIAAAAAVPLMNVQRSGQNEVFIRKADSRKRQAAHARNLLDSGRP